MRETIICIVLVLVFVTYLVIPIFLNWMDKKKERLKNGKSA